MSQESETFILVLNNTLDLTEGGYCIDTTLNSRAKYQVNFNSLFNQRQRLYKKCQVRYELLSEYKGNTPLQNVVGGIYITGLSTQNTLGAYGLPIANVLLPQISSAVEADGWFFNNRSTTDTNGVQLCSIPSGTQVIQVNFMSVLDVPLEGGNIPNYQLKLYFEFYDPVKPNEVGFN
jgi:hypothetical protein